MSSPAKKASITQLPVKRHPKLKRLLKRGIRIQKAEDEHVRYFYAGYKLGAFEGTIEGTDMSAQEFREALYLFMEPFTDYFVMDKGDDKPMALVVGSKSDIRMEIHCVWMPWATARNKLESVVTFFFEYNKWFTLITISPIETFAFFSHVRKYGVIREVGEIRNYSDKGVVYLFQGVKR